MRVRWRLSVMMGLVWAVQGAFWPLLAVHLRDLGIDGRERGWIFATLALGSFVMPLGAGHLVDRVWSTERLLALIYAVGTGLLAALALGVTTHPWGLFGLFLAYWLLTAPAVSLSASLVLRHLERPREEFGLVRLWGTFGWMSVGWLVSGVLAYSGSVRAGQGTYEAFWVAAALSLLLAGYCLTLPHTPPLDVEVEEEEEEAGLRAALGLLRERKTRVVLLTAFGFCLTTPFVYQAIPTYLESRGLARGWVAAAMSLAQWPEIASLAILPWLLGRLGDRGTLALGIVALGVRFGMLAFDPPLWAAVAGMPLHGVSIGCFLVGSQVYVDGRAPAHRRASAQALLTVLSSGLGCCVGSLLAGEVMSRASGQPGLVFLVPCVLNGTLLIYFGTGFRSNPTLVRRDGEPTTVCLPEGGPERGSVARVGILVTESADG
ncbi:MAG: MFS transporter [Isosphaeraceae bacterium]|nr:MFS transporter [Isosphaeraceae bacterium]